MIGIVCSLVLPIVVGIPKDRFPVAIFPNMVALRSGGRSKSERLRRQPRRLLCTRCKVAGGEDRQWICQNAY